MNSEEIKKYVEGLDEKVNNHYMAYVRELNYGVKAKRIIKKLWKRRKNVEMVEGFLTIENGEHALSSVKIPFDRYDQTPEEKVL